MLKTEQKKRVMACFTGFLWDGNENKERCRAIFKQYDGECIEDGTFLANPPQSNIDCDVPAAKVAACERALKEAGFYCEVQDEAVV
jgi:hypothetical protein